LRERSTNQNCFHSRKIKILPKGKEKSAISFVFRSLLHLFLIIIKVGYHSLAQMTKKADIKISKTSAVPVDFKLSSRKCCFNPSNLLISRQEEVG